MKTLDSNVKKAAVDMAGGLAAVFKKYSRHTREAAWTALTGKDGKKEIDKLIANPDRPINTFQKLSFREWMQVESKVG